MLTAPTLSKIFCVFNIDNSTILDTLTHIDHTTTMIFCVLTGEQYLSPSHAAEALKVSMPTVLKAITTGKAIPHRPLDMHTWLVGPNTPELQPLHDNRTRPISCTTTGTTYPTMSEAAADHRIDLTALSRALRCNRPVRSNTLDRQVLFVRV